MLRRAPHSACSSAVVILKYLTMSRKEPCIFICMVLQIMYLPHKQLSPGPQSCGVKW